MTQFKSVQESFGENDFVRWLHTSMPKSTKALIANGDDAALLATSPRGVLVATDMFLDGTHFISSETTPELIGRKAVAANLSDIAAMGGWPESVFISLGIPKCCSREWIERIMVGAAATAREFGCGIDGGDTNCWNGPLVVNVCVTGTPHWQGAVTRAGAKPGDLILVTGKTLGHSLETGRHLTFTPRLKEARWLMDNFKIHSMMDISDGLAADVPRLAEASKIRVTLDGLQVLGDAKQDPEELQAALSDGEDFELLFTCSKSNASEILKKFPFDCGVRKIGDITAGDGVLLIPISGGPATTLTAQGYEH